MPSINGIVKLIIGIAVILLLPLGTMAQDTTVWISAYNRTGQGSDKLLASRELADYYRKNGKMAEGLYWAEQGLAIVRPMGNDSLLWKQYDLIADLHDNSLRFDSSINYMLRSLALKKKHRNLRAIAGTYNDLGVVSGEKTDLVAQAAYYISAKKIYDQIGEEYEGLKVAVNLAGTYYRQGHYELALSDFHKLLPQLKRPENRRHLYTAYVRMTLCFASLKQVDSTFFYSALETKAAGMLNDHRESFEAWCRRAYMCSEFGNYKDYKQAIDSLMFHAALAKDEVNWGDYYSSLGIYQMKVTKQYNEAIKNLYKSYNLARQHADKTSALGTLTSIAMAYDAAGDHGNAYKVLQEAYALKDSIITEDGRQILTEMQTKYETGKKEATILLLDRDNKLKQRTSYFLIAGVGLLVIIIASLFRNNRLKQKSNSKLAVLNTALEEANQSKAKLFSILSHDLRSPVSNLYSYLQLKKIAPQMLNEDQQQDKEEQLFNSAGQLLNTMEDVLIWSKSQLESFVPEKMEVGVRAMVVAAVDMYEPKWRTKEITCTLPEQDMIVVSDENMLQTIIRNLIANAVTYTPEHGMIDITFNHVNSSIHIFNTGQPIAPSVAAQLFDWSHINSRSSGYGLKMSKALADKLGIEMYITPKSDGNEFSLKVTG